MTPTSTLRFTDLSEDHPVRVDLGDDLTVDHDVDQAIELYLDRSGIPRNDLEWSAYSRGVRLDKRSRLAELTDQDTDWMVVPTVSAGSR